MHGVACTITLLLKQNYVISAILLLIDKHIYYFVSVLR